MHTASWSEVSMSDCFWRVVHLLSHVRVFVTPWTVALQASLSFTISWSLLKLVSIESMVPSNHLIFCCPLLLLPSVFPSINVFYNVLAVGIRWPKYWSFSFSISPSSEYSEFISFRIDWFDLLAVQGQINEKDPISFMSLTSPYYYSNVLETSCSKNFINPLFVFHDWPGFFFF